MNLSNWGMGIVCTKWWWLGDDVYICLFFLALPNDTRFNWRSAIRKQPCWILLRSLRLNSIDLQMNSHFIRTCQSSWQGNVSSTSSPTVARPTCSNPAVSPSASRLHGRFEAVLFGSSATHSQVWEKWNWLAKFRVFRVYRFIHQIPNWWFISKNIQTWVLPN